MLNFKKLFHSFTFALKGIAYVFRQEQNFRIQLGVAVMVIILMFIFQVQIWQAVILILLIALVLVLELINTIFEKIVDLLKPRLHIYVEVIKDMMSAAVLVAALAAAIIGLLIFVPYLVDLF